MPQRRRAIWPKGPLGWSHFRPTDTDAEEFARYLSAANIAFDWIGDASLFEAELVHSREATFGHLVGPRGVLRWPRDSFSIRRAIVVYLIRGRVTARCDGMTANVADGILIIPPGTSRVDMDVEEDRTEAMYFSVPAWMLNDISLPPRPLIQTSTAPPLAIHAFAMTIVRNASSHEQSEALRSLLIPVAKALASSVQPAFAEETLTSRAIRTIWELRADPRLTLETVAVACGVATRTLQAALARGGTSFRVDDG